MAFIVVYDANVLVPARLRDLLMRIAAAGIVRARWSDRILDEWERAVVRRLPDVAHETIRRYRASMVDAVPDCLVSNFEVKHPDEFVLDAIDLYPGRVARIVREMSDDLKRPPQSVPQILATLAGHQLTRSAAKLGQLLGE